MAGDDVCGMFISGHKVYTIIFMKLCSFCVRRVLHPKRYTVCSPVALCLPDAAGNRILMNPS